MVSDLRVCIRCGYMLQGLRVSDRCPECGTEVELSLRDPRLADANPEYLSAIRSGLALLLYATLAIVGGVVMVAIVSLMGLAYQMDVSVVRESIRLFIAFALWPLIYVGVWRFTSPNPGAIEEEKSSSSRRVVRLTVIVQACLDVIAMFRWAAALSSSFTLPLQVVQAVVILLTIVNLIVHSGVMMQYARGLAGRVPDHLIVRRASRNVVLLPVLVGAAIPLSAVAMFLLACGGFLLFFVPITALVMYWNLLDRLRKHLRAMARGQTRAKLKGVDPRLG